MFLNFQPIILNVESMETSVETNFQPNILNDESMETSVETVFHNLHRVTIHGPKTKGKQNHLLQKNLNLYLW